MGGTALVLGGRAGSGTVTIQGLREFRAALRELDGQWPKELTKVHKELANAVVPLARSRLATYGRMGAKAAPSIRATASQQAARIAFGGARPPFALAAIMGAKRHTGWYGNARHFKAKTPQFPHWVGNNWDVGGSGGPRGVNDAIREMNESGRLVEMYGDMIEELVQRAFPD